MSTPRRTWFKLPDSIYREEWSNDVLATVVRLQAYMHERWARDDPEDASIVVIGPRAAMSITGTGRAHVALQTLSSLPLEAGWTSAGASLETIKGVPSVVLKCPKVAEFHGWTARRVPKRSPRNALSEIEIEIEIENKRREEEESSPKRSDAASRNIPIDSLWVSALTAFSAYGKAPATLSAARRKLLAGFQRDHPSTDAGQVVHGYMAMHADRGGEELTHLTPETVFRPSNRAKYVEAYREAIAAGRSPPFKSREVATKGHEPRVSAERWA